VRDHHDQDVAARGRRAVGEPGVEDLRGRREALAVVVAFTLVLVSPLTIFASPGSISAR
jgi:hypothetical protein